MHGEDIWANVLKLEYNGGPEIRRNYVTEGLLMVSITDRFSIVFANYDSAPPITKV
jgi:hypothetical protein